MALLKRSPRGLWLPGGQPTIDWANPITEGLVGFWVATGEQSNNILRDLVTNSVLTKTNSPTIIPNSVGMQACDLGTGGWSATAPASQRPTTQATLLWFGSIRGAIFGGNPIMFGISNNTTNASPFASFELFRNSATSVTLAYNNGSFQSVAYASSIVAGGTYGLVASINLGGKIFFYRNGSNFANSTAASGTIAYGAAAPVSVGLSVGANAFAGVGMCVGALWNRQLTPGESALISADPTNFLVFPGDLSIRVGAAAAGAVLAATPTAAATTTATLSTAIPMQSAPAAAAAVTAALTTAIPLLAAPAAVATVTGALTTAIPLLAGAVAVASVTAALTAPGAIWAAAAVGVATFTAALSTGIALGATPAAAAAVTAAFTTAIRLAASLFSAGTGSGTLTSFVPFTTTSPHLAVRRRMIARKGRNIILRHGGQTFTDTSFRAFVHAFNPREITEGLKQGDQHVETLSDVTPVVGDKVLIDSKPFNVLGVGVLYDGDTLLGYSLLVRG